MNLSSCLISSCKILPGGADCLFLDFSDHEKFFKLNPARFFAGKADRLLAPFGIVVLPLAPFGSFSGPSIPLFPSISSSFLFLIVRFSYSSSISESFRSVAASCCFVCWCCFLSSSSFD